MCEYRIVVVGNTCAGKTTFGGWLASRLSLPFIDLDALFWGPNWQPAELGAFRAKVERATSSSGWVLVGNYLRQQQDISWTRANVVIWLDVALPIVVGRILNRSFRRWRSGELLWGTNRERFFPQLKVWDEDASLIAFALRYHSVSRRIYSAAMLDPRWEHLDFQRFRSRREADQWLPRF